MRLTTTGSNTFAMVNTMADLSPAAQAVLDAFNRHPLHCDHIAQTLMHGALPAALHAAADQMGCYQSKKFLYSIADAMKLRNIAAELEGLT